MREHRERRHEEHKEHRERREHEKNKNHKEHANQNEFERHAGHRKHEEHKECKDHKAREAHNAWRREHYAAAGINDKLVMNLRDLSHTMRFLYEGKGSQKRILIILDEAGGSMTQRKLTERLGIQPGSASEVIAKLEGTGCISRTPNETDRRTSDIKLTEIGKQSADDARQRRQQRHEQMFSCLSDTEKNELLSLLEKVNTDWEERYQEMEDQPMQHEREHQPRPRRHHEKMHHREGE